MSLQLSCQFFLRELRLVLRPRRVRLALCAAIILSLVGSLFFWSSVLGSSLQLLEPCSDEGSRIYLENLCIDYESGEVGGSLCEPLCVRREVEFVRCLGHGVKMHVLQAQWAANTVVLKTPKPLGDHRATMHLYGPNKYQTKISKKEFIADANQTLYLNLAGGRHVAGSLAAVERVFSECDVLGDGQLSYSEAVVCWQLLETDEFVLLSVLEGTSAIPDLYGACGNMYAMQYATSDPFLANLPGVTDKRSWAFRARLAIALIEMVHSIEVTPYGTLYLCDVQESNFGLVRQSDSGQLVAKTIDVDISWFEASMISSVQFEKNKSCQTHQECDFISCHVPCNTTTHTCAGKLWSNNLQTVCRRLFLRKFHGFSGLLWGPPARVARELGAALDQCASFSALPQPHIDTLLMDRLLSLLRDSLLTDADSASQDRRT